MQKGCKNEEDGAKGKGYEKKEFCTRDLMPKRRSSHCRRRSTKTLPKITKKVRPSSPKAVTLETIAEKLGAIHSLVNMTDIRANRQQQVIQFMSPDVDEIKKEIYETSYQEDQQSTSSNQNRGLKRAKSPSPAGTNSSQQSTRGTGFIWPTWQLTITDTVSANKTDRSTDSAATETKEAEWTITAKKIDWTTTSTNDPTSGVQYKFQKEVLETLDKIVYEFDSLYHLVDSVDNRIDKLNEQIETVELKVDGSKSILDRVDNDIEDV
ncbi:unnamed protein product [Nippostrongylus brasiliensis]|uniref:t-SNARE coiled-coil homology domain-containing protein n=1 Tax=Nippostrongylus brasiliensis TaxID=27835 RepID=A0A0N4Y7G9_NIPBR|nr:unnamed protein product [Nippostrongylus brasiliensis]